MKAVLCHLLALLFVISITGATCCCGKETDSAATPASCCGEPADEQEHDCACDGQMPLAAWDHEWMTHAPDAQAVQSPAVQTSRAHLSAACIQVACDGGLMLAGPLSRRLALLQRYLI